MKILRPENAEILGKPADWNEEVNGPCEGLPIIFEDDGMVSFWQPEPEEMMILKDGGSLRLKIFGRGHPVVNVGVCTYPFEPANNPVADQSEEFQRGYNTRMLESFAPDRLDAAGFNYVKAMGFPGTFEDFKANRAMFEELYSHLTLIIQTVLGVESTKVN